MLEYLFKIIEETEIPSTQLLPTHINMLCTLCHTETVMMDTVLEKLCARDQVRVVQVG